MMKVSILLSLFCVVTADFEFEDQTKPNFEDGGLTGCGSTCGDITCNQPWNQPEPSISEEECKTWCIDEATTRLENSGSCGSTTVAASGSGWSCYYKFATGDTPGGQSNANPGRCYLGYWPDDENVPLAAETSPDTNKAFMFSSASVAPNNGAGADPITVFEGLKTRFYLPIGVPKTLYKQEPSRIEVAAVGGPPVGMGKVRRGDWMTEISLLVGGKAVVAASVRPYAPLLPEGVAASPSLAQRAVEEEVDIQAAGASANLTSLNLTVLGVPINTTGALGIEVGGLPVHVSVYQSATKPIGRGFAESATIKIGEAFELMLWTAKAAKFADEADQVKFAHLDFKLLKWDRKTATGTLPELWGLVKPMSAATEAMLAPHGTAKAQARPYPIGGGS